MQPYGKNMVAVGTDNAVYIAEVDNPRGWTRVRLNLTRTNFSDRPVGYPNPESDADRCPRGILPLPAYF